jgi:polyisoprenoid-binding protein YceI
VIDTEKPATPTPPTDNSSRWKLVILGAVVTIAAVAAGLFWFFGGDAPAEVDLSETASAVTGSTNLEESEVPIATGIEGTWAVDTSVGEFSVTEDTVATFAGFRVEEVLQSIGSTTAVGRSPAVSGTLAIDGTTLTSAELDVDLTSIVSDEPRREDKIQQALGTTANPNATFVLTEPVDLGDEAAGGELVSVTAVGELTINGVNNTVEIPLQAQLVDGMILVTGSTELLFEDYGVITPTAPVVLSVEDHGILEFQVWLSVGG